MSKAEINQIFNLRKHVPKFINSFNGSQVNLYLLSSINMLLEWGYFKLQRRHDSNGSSSDDNRSSGHASMSDGHTSSSPPVDRHHHYRSHLNSVPEDERLDIIPIVII